MADDVLRLKVDADTDGAVKGFKKVGDTASSELGKIEKQSATFGSKLKTNLGGAVSSFGGPLAIAAAAGAVAVKIGADAVKAASDMNEQVSKTEAVFGDSADSILKWSDTAATSFGQSKTQALEAASSFGNLFLQLGIGAGEATKMSTAITELSSDFASFFNTSPEEAIDAISAAFRGEYDAVQRFVPTINAAAVQQKALEMGLAGTTKELTEQDKALAAYELIMTGAGKAAGDFDRTSDSLANQSRVLSAQLKDMQAELGQGLLPVMASAAGAANTLLGSMRDLAGAPAPILEGIGRLAGGFLPFVEVLDSAKSGVERFTAAAKFMTPALAVVSAALGMFRANVEAIAEAGINLSGPLKAGTVDAGGFGASLDRASSASGRFAGSADAVAQNVGNEAQALRDANDALAAHTNAALAAIDASFAAADADRQWATALYEATAASQDNALSQGEQQKATDDAAQAALANAAAQVRLAEDNAKASGAAMTAKQSQDLLVGSLQMMAAQTSGPVQSAIQGLISKLQETGRQHPKPTIDVTDNATSKIDNARATLQRFAGLSATAAVNVTANTTAADNALQGFLSRVRNSNGMVVIGGLTRASGGPIPGGKNQPVPVMAHGGEYVLSADVVDRIKKGGPSKGAQAPGSMPAFATGGGGRMVNITINTGVGDPVAIGRAVKQAVREAERAGVN
jgi:hypothetical protein